MKYARWIVGVFGALLVVAGAAPILFFMFEREAYEEFAYGQWLPAHRGQLVQSPAHRFVSEQLSGGLARRTEHFKVRRKHLRWLPGEDQIEIAVSRPEWDQIARGNASGIVPVEQRHPQWSSIIPRRSSAAGEP